MTLQATTPDKTFSGNDSSTTFPFTFRVFANTDLSVKLVPASGSESVLIADLNYTLALNADQVTNPGGTITYPISGSPLATGDSLFAYRDTSQVQDTDLQNQGAYLPEVVETALDKITSIAQDVSERIRLAPLLKRNTGSPDLTLGEPVAGKLVRFNDAGDGIIPTGTTEEALATSIEGAGTGVFTDANHPSVEGDLVALRQETSANRMTVDGVNVALVSELERTNLVINGRLSKAVNQRSAASLTAATGYTYDRWYYDGTRVYQWIRNESIFDGTFIANWASDASLEYQLLPVATGAGAVPASGWTSISKETPFVLTGTASNNLWLRFTVGADGFAALDDVHLVPGSYIGPYPVQNFEEERLVCQSYYLALDANPFIYGGGSAGYYVGSQWILPTEMVRVPDVSSTFNTEGSLTVVGGTNNLSSTRLVLMGVFKVLSGGSEVGRGVWESVALNAELN